jgi:hypothetical protein
MRQSRTFTETNFARSETPIMTRFPTPSKSIQLGRPFLEFHCPLSKLHSFSITFISGVKAYVLEKISK